MESLQDRLSTGLLITTVVLVAAVLGVGGYALRHLLEEFVAARLEHDMDAILVALQLDGGNPQKDIEIAYNIVRIQNEEEQKKSVNSNTW